MIFIILGPELSTESAVRPGVCAMIPGISCLTGNTLQECYLVVYNAGMQFNNL